MDYKDKYNRLVEAVKVLQEANPSDEGIQNWVKDNVPELRESEDEKIRKKIIILVNAHGQGRFKESMLAWLEKLKVFTEQGDGLYHFGNSEFTYVGNPTWDNVSFLENQCEHKPFDYENATIVQKDFAPKGEPRFNIGDWIVSDKPYINNYYRLCKVVGISDGYYTIQTIDGLKGYNTFKEWESDYHLWSIKDAKKGDVLSSELCGTIMLYKGIEDNNIQFYCDYDFSDIDVPGARFAINNGQHYGSVDDCEDWHPATKEQRDLLFQKMHEAGYTFDFESKELKNTEQNPTWAVDDDEEFEIAINTLKGAGQYDSAAWLITLKQRLGE